MKNKICKYCGREKRLHTTVVIGDSNYPEGITVESAKWELRCSPHEKQKFKPQETAVPGGGVKNKGCGKKDKNTGLFCGCNIGGTHTWLCKSCKPKNSSPGEKNHIPNIKEELKDYNRKDLIEEIARLRLVVIKRNIELFKKHRDLT